MPSLELTMMDARCDVVQRAPYFALPISAATSGLATTIHLNRPSCHRLARLLLCLLLQWVLWVRLEVFELVGVGLVWARRLIVGLRRWWFLLLFASETLRVWRLTTLIWCGHFGSVF